MFKGLFAGLATTLFTLLFAVSLSAPHAFAIEGTCSSHGGVNCNIGPDWDGSAICNDGWRDSSEAYANQIACQNSHHYCTQAESAEINAKYNIDAIEQAIAANTAAVLQLQKDAIAASQTAENRQVPMFSITGEQAQIERQQAIQALALSSQSIQELTMSIL